MLEHALDGIEKFSEVCSAVLAVGDGFEREAVHGGKARRAGVRM
jgi:hypothetical protein